MTMSYEGTWWKLFQRRVVRTYLNVYIPEYYTDKTHIIMIQFDYVFKIPDDKI